MIKIEDLKSHNWTSQWAGRWSLLTFSYWGKLYQRKPFTKKIKSYVNNTVIVTRDGNSAAYQSASDKEKFGKEFSELVISDNKYINQLCSQTKKATDNFLHFVKKYYQKDILFEKYLEFQDLLVNKYYPLHIQNKMGPDYLDADLLKKYFSQIESTRIYLEPVFDQSERFMVALAKIHAKKNNYDYRLILSTTKDEFHNYFTGQKQLPPKKILQKRYQAAALISQNGLTSKVFIGKDVDKIEALILASKQKDEIKGASAYPGKATGKVRIIFNPQKAKNFKQGDILVTNMTRPNFLSLMKKAAGYVTDSGGILCHAAIVARELKKPCVIGTEIATKVLKDGDLVEVDADKGIVKKLK